MLFNSWAFAAFWIVVYGAYLVMPHRWQNRWLLVASYAFYGAWDWRFLFLLTASALIDYGVGLAIARASAPRRRRRLLAISVAANLSILGVFKYYDFFAESAQQLLARAGATASLPLVHVVLPVGISFYTFQSMSYAIDVYRGEVVPTDRIDDFLLFVSFFPHLVAGPIMRARTLLTQIVRPRAMTANAVAEGGFLIFWGLFLKVFVADNLALLVDPVFASRPPYDGGAVLLAVYAFAFQIYGDFAGYSSIARGLGKCMGFDLAINFRQPYAAASPSEFWRRWHISLSTWLRDYLYIPLGGSRGSRGATYRNLVVTMLLGGLWHGAAWTFVAWGAYQALLLTGQRAMGIDGGGPSAARRWAARAITFHLIAFGWLLFRARSLSQVGLMALAVASSLHAPAANDVRLMLAVLVPLVAGESLLDARTLLPRPAQPAVRALMYVGAFYLLAVFGAHAGREFIYFQF